MYDLYVYTIGIGYRNKKSRPPEKEKYSQLRLFLSSSFTSHYGPFTCRLSYHYSMDASPLQIILSMSCVTVDSRRPIGVEHLELCWRQYM